MIDFQKIINFFFCAIFLVLPVFYIPKIGTSYIFNQKLLLIAFLFLIFVFGILKITRAKKFNLKWNPALLCLAGFFIFSSFSFLLGKNIVWESCPIFFQTFFQSFLGKPNSIDSFFMIFVYCCLAFMAGGLFRFSGNILKILKSFVVGATFLSSIFLISILTNFKNDFFVPIESFSLVFALGLAVLMAVFSREREWPANKLKIIFPIFSFLVLILSILIIGDKLSWFLVFLAGFLIFWRQAVEKDFSFKDLKVIVFLIITGISFVLFFIPNIINYNFQLGYEQSIFYGSAIQITQKTLTESFKNFVFGSGPATYLYEYSLYKGSDLGYSSLVFNQSPIAFLTLLGSLGVGAIVFLIFIWSIFLKQGFSFLLKNLEKEKPQIQNELKAIIFPIKICLLVVMFLYKMTIVPMVLLFFLMGVWISLEEKNKVEINFEKKYFPAKIIFICFFGLMIIGSFFFFRQYLAESFYQLGVRNYYFQKDIDFSRNKGIEAISLFGSGDYYVGVSQLYILKASEIFNQDDEDGSLSEQDQNEVRNLASQAEAMAKTATKIEPLNFNNWYNLGLIYENTSFLIKDENKQALSAYAMAEKLAPYNTDIYLAEGRLSEKQGHNKEAAEYYEKALALNPKIEGLEEKIESLKKLLN